MAWNWSNISDIGSHAFVCGYCGNDVASQLGYYAQDRSGNLKGAIYVCHQCDRPTYIEKYGGQYPGPAFGEKVDHIEDEAVAALYNEARNCLSAGANTASVLCCRKLLMNIAVSKGALEGEPFAAYVKFLSDNHYIPPDAKDWVDHIRQKGNEATHDIKIRTQDEAEEILSFITMLLKLIFEFPVRVRPKSS